MAKQGTDLQPNTFAQYVAYEVSRHGFLEKHVKRIVEVYRTRRDVMLNSLETNMPEGVTWTHPEGGLFLWLTLPEGCDTQEMLVRAVEKKVAFVPGHSFHPNGGGKNTMRLNFSYAQPDMIKIGIQRLSETIKEQL